MAIRQQKIPSFVIDNEDDEKIKQYLTKNSPLLKGRMLVFDKPVSTDIKAILDHHLMVYSDQGHFDFLSKNKKKIDNNVQDEQIVSHDVTTISKAVRSGEIIKTKGDAIVTQNINDGALVQSEGSLTLFGILLGDIECNGNYLITRPSKRGKVRFQGTDIQDKLIYDGLQIVTKVNGEIMVKAIG